MSHFQQALLEDHGIDLPYPSESHELRAGQDGSIIVIRSSDRRPDNPDGPALVMIDGTERVFRNGAEVVEASTDAPDVDEDQSLPAPGL